MFLPTFVLKNHVDFITQDLLGELVQLVATPKSLMADFLLQHLYFLVLLHSFVWFFDTKIEFAQRKQKKNQ